MGQMELPVANRIHIGFFGKRNSGKSSLVNAITGQQSSIVSDVPGTTTDYVTKAMELLPAGPVVLMDTPGIDDEGRLGEQRIEKAYEALRKTDVAILVSDGSQIPSAQEEELIKQFERRKLPYLLVVNKEDIISEQEKERWKNFIGQREHWFVSAEKDTHVEQLKKAIAQMAESKKENKPLVSDLVNKGQSVILVTPIDAAAPKGRLILPQQQVLRELLDCGAITMVVQPQELADALKMMTVQPGLVITDSQVFSQVNKIVPTEVPLTSFSILFARYKGLLWDAVSGARMLDRLCDKDCVLISEGCSHHRQCGDIGTEKLPSWIKKYTGKQIEFTWTSGQDFPKDLSSYRLVIHCGGCMLNDKEMQHRLSMAKEAAVAMTNYGTAIAHMNQILERSIEPLK